MQNETVGLLLTFGLSIFILLGSFIVFFTKNNDKFIRFSIGMAFSVMMMIVIFDLVPEALEIFRNKYSFEKTVIMVLLISLMGVGLLKILDFFIPHHHDHENHDNDHIKEANFYHIGIISSITLVLHNMIEGMAVYSVLVTNMKAGIFLSIGIGLHNIPLGMIIASAFYKKNKNKKKTLFISFLISISTFLGGLIMMILKNNMNEMVLGVLLCITLGMIIYITLFELLPHVLNKQERKESLLGVLSGIILLTISILLF